MLSLLGWIRVEGSGHLWQDRYKSKFIISENYLYTLIRYIEYNPLEASMYEKVGIYNYTLSHLIFKNKSYYPCCSDSILLKEFDIKTLNEFLGEPMSVKEQEYLKEKAKQKIDKDNNSLVIKQSKKFEEHFYDNTTKLDRNLAILNAYGDGYPQVDIANYLKVSTSLVSKIIKSGYSTPGV